MSALGPSHDGRRRDPAGFTLRKNPELNTEHRSVFTRPMT